MLEVLVLAIALSMDAFVVSITLGINKRSENLKDIALKSGLYFGIFQALMPLIGYIGGIALNKFLSGYDKYIAFGLLLIIGGKMIYEAFTLDEDKEEKDLSHKMFFALAIATSIDAVAAGFTLHLFELDVILSIIIIGIVTFIFSYMGVYFGNKGGEKYETKAEVAGGVILILIGLKILLF